MASVRCPECDHKERIPDDYERSTIRCSECGVKIPVEIDDDEEDRPRRKKKKKKAGKNFFAPYLSLILRLDTSLKVILGLTLVAMLISCIHPVMYLVPMIYGFILVLLGGGMFLLIAFNDSPTELLLCLFVPFYSLYYLITHWGETRPAFLMQIYGWVVCFSFLCAVPFHALIFGAQQTLVGKPAAKAPGK